MFFTSKFCFNLNCAAFGYEHRFRAVTKTPSNVTHHNLIHHNFNSFDKIEDRIIWCMKTWILIISQCNEIIVYFVGCCLLRIKAAKNMFVCHSSFTKFHVKCKYNNIQIKFDATIWKGCVCNAIINVSGLSSSPLLPNAIMTASISIYNNRLKRRKCVNHQF